MNNFFGLRVGKVFNTHFETNTIDVLWDDGRGAAYEIPVATPFGSTNSGYFELPTPANAMPPNQNSYVYDFATQAPKVAPNLYPLENTSANNPALESPTYNNVYAIVGLLGESSGMTMPVCIGFILPDRNQMMFDPNKINPGIPLPVQTALKAMAGGMIHRTNSGVYWTVDTNGNAEFAHPNGSFLRLAQSPTQEEDGVVHVDLTGANARAVVNGSQSTLAWNTSYAKGADGVTNASRHSYFHMEIVTASGVVELDINKTTGNVTIRTPVNTSGASASSNQLNIICGGDATIESVQGNVTLQSANGNVTVEGKNTVTVKTDDANDNSIVLAPNAPQVDVLPLFKKLEKKFNHHVHNILPTGVTDFPDQQLDATTDATVVTTAG